VIGILIADIWLWMTEIILKLSYGKINLIYLGSPHSIGSITIQTLVPGTSSNALTGLINNLEVISDKY